MTLGSQMNDTIHILILHQLKHTLKVADIHLDELIVGLVLYVAQIVQIASVGQFVKIYYFIIRILIDKKADHMATYKACSAGYDY